MRLRTMHVSIVGVVFTAAVVIVGVAWSAQGAT